ncbi:MAG: UDP-N-acetylglucosamine 2-epimerase (hydrolyzing) [Muribaculaceae bacterium]|nr:UDP-N-acetylglucosamine 2-epimerase (hydrolyzing) [Muribaculaceae bacterium]
MFQRKIAIITTTRADWGLLHPVAVALREKTGKPPIILAGNSHLDPERGLTVNEIIADGFSPVYMQKPMDFNNRSSVMTATLASVAGEIERNRPDIVLLLGDRFEMLAAASAVAACDVPIAHISGGEITEGAVDDNFRHAITKLASLHFVTTEEHRHRVIQIGEQPTRVINTGAIGVSNVADVVPVSRQELERSLGFELGHRPVLVTFHPATMDPVSPAERFAALLTALDRHSELSPLFTYPNNDDSGRQLISMIEEYVATHSGARAVASLGRERYLSALSYVEAVVGNSSSGLVEVPSAGIPTVDIGIRQRGRTAGASVIHCGDSADEIFQAISLALSPEMKEKASQRINPYMGVDPVKTIVDTLTDIDVSSLLPKKFHDIDFTISK